MRSVNRRAFLATAGPVFTLFPGASGVEAAKRPTGDTEVWVRTELYFGSNHPNGEVTDAQFRGFVDSEVTRLFPEGFTILTGYGQFKTSEGAIIRERSRVLILFYPPQQQDVNRKITELRDLYKKAYAQESVLRADSYSFVSF